MTVNIKFFINYKYLNKSFEFILLSEGNFQCPSNGSWRLFKNDVKFT